MKKFRIMFLMSVVSILVLTGCTNAAIEDPANNISIAKDKSVTYRIHESFGQDYYDMDELKSMIISEAAEYNTEHEEDSVSLSRLENKDGIVNVEMTFKTAKDFTEFNNINLFVGNGQEAQASGYSVKAILTNVKDATQTISESDLKQIEDDTILISDSIETIYLPKKVQYASDNCIVSADYSGVSLKEGDKGVFIVVY